MNVITRKIETNFFNKWFNEKLRVVKASLDYTLEDNYKMSWSWARDDIAETQDGQFVSDISGVIRVRELFCISPGLLKEYEAATVEAFIKDMFVEGEISEDLENVAYEDLASEIRVLKWGVERIKVRALSHSHYLVQFDVYAKEWEADLVYNDPY